VKLFKEGLSCSQAILSVYGADRGVSGELLAKLGTGFAGGMARMGLACGAFTGGVMALGLAYGQAAADDGEAKEKTFAFVQEFAERFRERHGALDCRGLLGYDLSTPEGRAAAKASGRVDTFCPTLVRSAAEILEELL
jgi:C_GCAxxG_C_C family probable redox protein